MVRTTRRGVLCALGVAATAGCSEALGGLPGGGDGGSGGGKSQKSPLRAERIKHVSEVVTLPRNEHKAYELSLDRRGVLLYEVVADAKIDVITLTSDGYETYRNGDSSEVPFIRALSEQDTRAAANGSDVTAGEPVVVIDNTTWAKAQPVENVTCEVELELFVRPEHADG